MENNHFISGFRYAAPYINSHRGQRFVIALNGSSVAHPNFKNIVHDIAVLQSLGIHIVIVHGFRQQIETALEKNNISSQYHRGLRITDKSHLDTIEQIAGQLRIKIEAAFSTSISNSPLYGAEFKLCSGNWVTAKPIGVLDGIDMQHTGTIRNIDISTLEENIQQKNISLLSTLAYSSTGEVFNLSLIDLAQKTALQLKADKLIIFQKEQGLLNADNLLIRQINSRKGAPKVDTKQAHLCQHLIEATQEGIHRAHVLSHAEDGALLNELFTHIGAGTLVSQEEYEKMRPAEDADINNILELIEPFEEKGILVKRSRELLENEIHHFIVVECDQRIIGCAALYQHGDSAEIACIVTHLEYQKKGLAARLLQALEHQAKEKSCASVFVLSTQTTHWFIEQGFHEDNIDSLPESKKDLYNYTRNSKVLTKQL